MRNNELILLLSLAKSTIAEKKQGLITSQEANKVFIEIKDRISKLDDEMSKSIFDKLISSIEF